MAEKTIAVLTSGGDAPGMNAAIRAAVSYTHLEVYKRQAKYRMCPNFGGRQGDFSQESLLDSKENQRCMTPKGACSRRFILFQASPRAAV